MTDPRIATVADVLIATASTNGPDDTDTVATKIVNALDAVYGPPANLTDEPSSEGTDPAAGDTSATSSPANPESPVTAETGGALTNPAG
jgi:hypothetical protein